MSRNPIILLIAFSALAGLAVVGGPITPLAVNHGPENSAASALAAPPATRRIGSGGNTGRAFDASPSATRGVAAIGDSSAFSTKQDMGSASAVKAKAAARAFPAPPPTPKRPVKDTYHGIEVTEEYRWLENWSDPQVQRWSEAQNRYARVYLDALPSVPALTKRLKELEASTSPDYRSLQYRHRLLFAIKSQPPKEQPFLITLASPDDLRSEQVVVDPNKIDAKGGTSIDFYVPSLDGRLVAVCMSKNGSEDGSVHVYEVATGRKLPDVISRVNYGTAGGSLAWNADGTGFFYTRYPREGERTGRDRLFYQQVWFHKLGTPPGEDRYSIGKEFPKIAEVQLETTDDGRHVLASVANGDGGEYAHYLLSPRGGWTQITRFSDKVVRAKFGPDDALYLLSRNGAPNGTILRLPLSTPSLDKAQTAVETANVSIQDLEPAADKLYVVDVAGGPSQIRAFDLQSFHSMADGKSAPVPIEGKGGRGAKEWGNVPLAPISAVSEILRMDGNDVLYRSQTYLDPPAWYRYRAGDEQAARTALRRASPAEYGDTEVSREFATSKDGTRVPINIMRLKGTKLDGTNPTILSGYGGYGINMTPHFSEGRRAWIEQGGVYVQANLRGGGEFGEDWHTSGNLTKKQNVFDDLAAAAKYLFDARYTTPGKLAIEGGSNGGLLMGAALTQHPELYRAVVSHVGIYDMLRVELSPNGEFNTTEFGTVKDPDQFRALYGYSPYHHVVDGTPYPAVLFLTGANDPRVDPMNSRKMTARLQAATSSGRPVLLRTSASSGHGIGSSLSETVAEHVDVFAFLFDQLGATYRPVEAAQASEGAGSRGQ